MPQNESGPSVPAERAAKTNHRAEKYTPPKATLASVPLDDFEIEEGSRVFVPPGIYHVAFVDWSTCVLFGKARKLALTFRIVDPGESFGKQVNRWYNTARLIGRPGPHGRFKATKGSDFIADYVRLVGMPSRTDRASLTKLMPLLIKAEVSTVTTNQVQKEIAEPLRYSVVRRLISVEAGRSL
jgi:hypothetical protein